VEEAQRISTIAESHFASLFQKRQEIYRILTNDELALYEGRMQVRQLMTRQVHTVRADASITEVRQKLREHEMRHLLACSAAGELLGIISDRDLKGSVEKAADLMTRSVFTVDPNTFVSPAINSILDNQVSSLPVVEDGKLVGIITTSDFLMALQCTLQLITKTAAERATSADACPTS
jgi:acetoin utilization protein AcuB